MSPDLILLETLYYCKHVADVANCQVTMTIISLDKSSEINPKSTGLHSVVGGVVVFLESLDYIKHLITLTRSAVYRIPMESMHKALKVAWKMGGAGGGMEMEN